jgi:hypothetical protein
MGASSPIETLAGAQNLSEIADIEYIQKKLLTALRIPKAFLGFEEVVGDGKNLSLQDIRFARTINRIQKSMIAELNKIAIIHLFLLGFEDELGNFTLGLTNPSKQADLLSIDVMKEKMLLYKDLVSPIEGIAPTSQTWAKKHVLGMSDEEIKLDLQQQRFEKAVSAEIQNTASVITKTGLFDNIDKLYGGITGATSGIQAGESPTPEMGGLPDLGGMGGEIPPPEIGGGDFPEEPIGGPEVPDVVPENKMDKINILVEGNFWSEKESLDLSKANQSFEEMSDELERILKS